MPDQIGIRIHSITDDGLPDMDALIRQFEQQDAQARAIEAGDDPVDVLADENEGAPHA